MNHGLVEREQVSYDKFDGFSGPEMHAQPAGQRLDGDYLAGTLPAR